MIRCDEGSIVTFWLGDRQFGINALDVVEVMPFHGVTRVPGTSRRVVGVTTWRGETIPVLDVATLLKPGRPTPDDKTRLLVLRHPGPYAVLIDRPGQVLQPGETSFVELSQQMRDEPRGILDLVRSERGLVRVLDPVRLLGSESDLVSGAEPARPLEAP